MQTQLSITVKNEFFLYKIFTLSGFVQTFRKSRVNLWIDGQKQVLEASKEPYVFDLAPGKHEIIFSDYLEKAKGRYWKVIFGFVFFAMFLAAGGREAAGGAMLGSKTGEISKKANVMDITLNEGDMLNLVCQTKIGSKVKVWSE